MRILAFAKGGKPALGVRTDDGVVDLSVAAPRLGADLAALLKARALGLVKAAAKNANAKAYVKGKIRHLPPIARPGKIVCVGLNYLDHAAESPYKEKPKYPVLFLRVDTSLVGHGAPLVRPRASVQFDYEAEMVAVIGKTARDVPAAKALGHVMGYSIFNDGSVRDYQFHGPQWTMGKNFDGSGPFGPEIVTADELPPGGAGLGIQCRLNGQVVQDANTNDLIFPVAELVSYISQAMTLEPGDIIVTGTPAGVGHFRKPPLYMKAGDTCEVEIERIGTLANPVVDQK